MGDSIKNLIQSFLNPNAHSPDPSDALIELGSLSQLTEASLHPEKVETVAPAASSVTTSAAPATRASENPLFMKRTGQTHPTSSNHSAKTQNPPALDPTKMEVSGRYQGKNIQDKDVLQALMEYHQSRAPVRGVKSSPIAQAQASQRPQKNHSSFGPAEIPVIEAQPKLDTYAKRSSLPTTSILKSPTKK